MGAISVFEGKCHSHKVRHCLPCREFRSQPRSRKHHLSTGSGGRTSTTDEIEKARSQEGKSSEERGGNCLGHGLRQCSSCSPSESANTPLDQLEHCSLTFTDAEIFSACQKHRLDLHRKGITDTFWMGQRFELAAKGRRFIGNYARPFGTCIHHGLQLCKDCFAGDLNSALKVPYLWSERKPDGLGGLFGNLKGNQHEDCTSTKLLSTEGSYQNPIFLDTVKNPSLGKLFTFDPVKILPREKLQHPIKGYVPDYVPFGSKRRRIRSVSSPPLLQSKPLFWSMPELCAPHGVYSCKNCAHKTSDSASDLPRFLHDGHLDDQWYSKIGLRSGSTLDVLSDASSTASKSFSALDLVVSQSADGFTYVDPATDLLFEGTTTHEIGGHLSNWVTSQTSDSEPGHQVAGTMDFEAFIKPSRATRSLGNSSHSGEMVLGDDSCPHSVDVDMGIGLDSKERGEQMMRGKCEFCNKLTRTLLFKAVPLAMKLANLVQTERRKTLKSNDDLSLPKATVQKIVQEILPPGTTGLTFAKDARDLLIECCVEFITLISSEANEISEKENKKTIACEHITKALEQLGFGDYVQDIVEVASEHKEQLKGREKKANKLEQSGLSTEELLRMQEEAFRDAAQRHG